MALPTTFSNGIKVYNLTAEKAVPQWQADSKGPRKKLSAEFKRRIELLQNFEFPSACSKICVSADGTYLLATGTYKPMVKAFELSQLSLKFERHLDSTTEDFVVLSEDYSKMCFLRSDKVLEFHTQTGSFFKAQIPRYGRSLVFFMNKSFKVL